MERQKARGGCQRLFARNVQVCSSVLFAFIRLSSKLLAHATCFIQMRKTVACGRNEEQVAFAMPPQYSATP